MGALMQSCLFEWGLNKYCTWTLTNSRKVNQEVCKEFKTFSFQQIKCQTWTQERTVKEFINNQVPENLTNMEAQWYTNCLFLWTLQNKVHQFSNFVFVWTVIFFSQLVSVTKCRKIATIPFNVWCRNHLELLQVEEKSTEVLDSGK